MTDTERRERKEKIAGLVSALRKEKLGKAPDRIEVTLVGFMVVISYHGNLTPVERFICQTPSGRETVRNARTELIKKIYTDERPVQLERIVDANFVEIFSDINVEKDWAMTVFVFDRPVDGTVETK